MKEHLIGFCLGFVTYWIGFAMGIWFKNRNSKSKGKGIGINCYCTIPCNCGDNELKND